jgi:hypothetical protein
MPTEYMSILEQVREKTENMKVKYYYWAKDLKIA